MKTLKLGFVLAVFTHSLLGASFYDNFDRPNGSLGPQWRPIEAGNGFIAYGAVRTNWYVLAHTVGFSAKDVTVRADVRFAGRPQNQAEAGVIARLRDMNNYYFARFVNRSSGIVTVELLKKFNGRWTQLGETPIYQDGGELELSVIGSELKVAVDGYDVLNAYDSQLRYAGHAAVRIGGDPIGYIDTFSATGH